MNRKILFFCALVYLLGLLMMTLFFGGSDKAYTQNVDAMLMAPSAQHWFGTDSLGRDVFSRVFLGARVSLIVGLVCASLATVMGFIYGACSGWGPVYLDRFLMRLLDIVMAIPSFILISVLVLSFQSLITTEDSFWGAMVSLCLGISLTHWMTLARVTRGMVLELKQRPFVEAAVALGGNGVHILGRHILPNMLSTLLVMWALLIPSAMIYESFMSFIGLGIQPPATSWGILVKDGWKSLSSFPHLILFPSLVLFLTVWSFHVILDFFRKTNSRELQL